MPGVAGVRGGHQRVRDQAEAGGVHPGLGQQPGLDHRDEVRALVLLASSTTTVSNGVRQPVPVLADEGGPPGAGGGDHRERRASVRSAAAGPRLARLRREHHLGAHVDREHVPGVDDRPSAMPDLLQVRGPEGGDGRLRTGPPRGAPSPVPPGPSRRRPPGRPRSSAHAVAGLRPVLPAALPGRPSTRTCGNGLGHARLAISRVVSDPHVVVRPHEPHELLEERQPPGPPDDLRVACEDARAAHPRMPRNSPPRSTAPRRRSAIFFRPRRAVEPEVGGVVQDPLHRELDQRRRAGRA